MSMLFFYPVKNILIYRKSNWKDFYIQMNKNNKMLHTFTEKVSVNYERTQMRQFLIRQT